MSEPSFSFKVTGALRRHGRSGLLTTPHGWVRTPVFMPVGTNATVKSLSPDDLREIGTQIILANNYHLFLRPGPGVIKQFGGIHRFMNWSGPMLTDSGGFQIQSLGREEIALCRVSDAGVEFRSHLDGGSLHLFTPEIATQSQIDIGADIIMALDQSVPQSASRSLAKTSIRRTRDWLTRCVAVWKQHSDPARQALFGIIQGGEFPDLLTDSAKFVIEQNLPGIAIGGAVIGVNPQQTSQTIAVVRSLLPKDKPLYAMGVGAKPSDLISVVEAGADMFDCVAPTRRARSGQLFVSPDLAKTEVLDISKRVFRLDKGPVDSACDCSTCAQFTRGYLHHLFKCKELLFHRLASIHNLRFACRVVQSISIQT